MSILRKSDSVMLPRCLLNYGRIGSGSGGREGEILDTIFYV